MPTLKIEPGIGPHESKFVVDGRDITDKIAVAQLTFNYIKEPPVLLHIVADIDIPDEMDAQIFKGNRTNGNTG